MTIADQIKAARRVSTPLIGLTTADPPATVARILKAFNGKAPALLQHDIIRGVVGLNDEGKAARGTLLAGDDGPELPGNVPLQSPAEALAKCASLPARALLFVHNAGRLVDDPAVCQAICNLRDLFKADGRTLVLLAPVLTLPPELVQDVMVIDEPLPTEAEIVGILDQELKNAAEMSTPPAVPDDDTRRRSVEAVSGLAAFPIEQAFAMSLAQGGLYVDQLWARKRGFIQQTRGLSLDTGAETFDDIGGNEHAKTFGRGLFLGRKKPRAVVRIDEIEKMIGGAAGDTSGTSQDALATILREMEDQNWAGLIAVGPPGSGKSMYSKTLGRTFGAPTFALDLGAAKGSLVGQSEERIRQAMKVIRAVAADGAFFVATCNKLDALPPELRRRFRYGLWFFDLPTVAEREAIWALNAKAFELTTDQMTNRPAAEDWTGAEIRNVCELAWRMNVTVKEAAAFIVPVAVSDPASINKLRDTAHLKFLSASYAGPYRHAKAPNAPAIVPDAGRRQYAEDK